ncbi:hypothetical protein [Lysinibacillus sp. LZ02]|uniref:hypothetical protein n=1 Tax=Lysinibacillus sp. LZ02 TaxID=3420668 RepID=UPI003D35EE56
MKDLLMSHLETYVLDQEEVDMQVITPEESEPKILHLESPQQYPEGFFSSL